MRRFALSELSRPLEGRLLDGDASFGAVCTDSRALQPGDLFVALRGERFDGHRFLGDACSAGAAAAVVAQDIPEPLPTLKVSDTREALGRLAALNRSHFEGALVGITGSCGKTSVKNMLAAILGELGSTHATAGNYNNEVGMPLTLLQLEPRHRYAVIEMAAARQGDIRYLCDIARPDVSVLLNALPAHLEGFGSVDAVARAKGEIFQGLDPDATAVINGDSDHAPLWREMAAGSRRIEFGLAKTAAVSAGDIACDGPGCRFTLLTPAGETLVELALPGRHQVMNALAAAAAAVAIDASPDAIAAGLAKVRATEGRLVHRELAGGVTLIDDSYNANPGSVKAAIDLLAGLSGRRWLVLGAMSELGADSESLHGEVGRYAREAGIDRCWVTGGDTPATASAFGEGGRHFDSRESLLDALRGDMAAGDTVLVKGSRSASMDWLVTTLSTGEEH